jgi:hypothetical protein
VDTISDDLMRNPDMWDSAGEACLLVVKNGNATGTTIGRANGIFSIVRDYFNDPSINQTSMEWGIINYDSKSEVFSKPAIRARSSPTFVAASAACSPVALARRSLPT